jgi:hypothetical protein
LLRENVFEQIHGNSADDKTDGVVQRNLLDAANERGLLSVAGDGNGRNDERDAKEHGVEEEVSRGVVFGARVKERPHGKGGGDDAAGVAVEFAVLKGRIGVILHKGHVHTHD